LGNKKGCKCIAISVQEKQGESSLRKSSHKDNRACIGENMRYEYSKGMNGGNASTLYPPSSFPYRNSGEEGKNIRERDVD